ncbi:MAG: hypothetical protein RR323_00120 [Raoultibacter sp.]
MCIIDYLLIAAIVVSALAFGITLLYLRNKANNADGATLTITGGSGLNTKND